LIWRERGWEGMGRNGIGMGEERKNVNEIENENGGQSSFPISCVVDLLYQTLYQSLQPYLICGGASDLWLLLRCGLRGALLFLSLALGG
jgi:hypothetical protein